MAWLTVSYFPSGVQELSRLYLSLCMAYWSAQSPMTCFDNSVLLWMLTPRFTKSHSFILYVLLDHYFTPINNSVLSLYICCLFYMLHSTPPINLVSATGFCHVIQHYLSPYMMSISYLILPNVQYSR